jgi:hypothetical protein
VTTPLAARLDHGQRRLDGDGAAKKVDDLARRRTRAEYRGDARVFELVGIVLRNRRADDHDNIVGIVRLKAVNDPGNKRHVRARENRYPDGVGVFLNRGLHDLLRCLVQTRSTDRPPSILPRIVRAPSMWSRIRRRPPECWATRSIRPYSE